MHELARYPWPDQMPVRGNKNIKEQWLDCLETAMANGFDSPKLFEEYTSIDRRTYTALKKAVYARWAADTTPGLRNIRREQLYNETNRVALSAWARLDADPDMPIRDFVALQRLVVDSVKRRAALSGADKPVEIDVSGSVVAVSDLDYVAGLGFDPSQLAALGAYASSVITVKAMKALAVIDD